MMPCSGTGGRCTYPRLTLAGPQPVRVACDRAPPERTRMLRVQDPIDDRGAERSDTFAGLHRCPVTRLIPQVPRDGAAGVDERDVVQVICVWVSMEAAFPRDSRRLTAL